MVISKMDLENLAKYILDGMTEDEACILCSIDKYELQDLKETNIDVRNFMEDKHVKFKYKHLQEIQKIKSEKNSQWLLEKLRPEEFGNKMNKNSNPTTVNIIRNIINQIQNGEQQSYLSPTNRRDSEILEAEVTVESVLN